jgi:Zn-dependent protease with chaperone function
VVKNLKALLGTAAFLVAIPLIGLFIGHLIEAHYDQMVIDSVVRSTGMSRADALARGVSVRALCANAGAAAANEDACAEAGRVILLQQISLGALAGGLGLIALVLISAAIVGRSRSRLALLFNPVATLSILLLSCSIFVQGAILVYSFYLVTASFFSFIMIKLILLLAFGALFASFALARSAFSFLRDSDNVVLGKRITQENGAPLLALIRDLADKVGARAPDNVVLGVEPSFYVTAARLRVASDSAPLSGTTMFISMPFLGLFTRDELCAVIGHELGHFKGEDTAYSMRFYPAYSKLSSALASMHAQAEDTSAATVFALPARSMLSFILGSFGTIERTIGRARELEADKVGASASSSEALISALLKFSEYVKLWGPLRHHNMEKLAEGQVYGNLPGLYCSMAQSAYAELDFDTARSELVEYKMAHPTDTHPTLTERIAALGMDEHHVAREMLAPAATPLAEYLTEVTTFAKEVSLAEHQFMVAIGAVTVPEQSRELQIDE